MPLLAYCIVLDRAMNLPSEGVLSSALEPIEESGLAALCSELERSLISATNFQQAALEFHGVIQAVLAENAVVPFRFPTWLSAEEMRGHLREKSSQYQDFLIRHADHLQMEVRLLKQKGGTSGAASGAEHLRARAAQLRAMGERAKEVKHQLADTVIEWREVETGNGTRLYALVSRKSIESFREKLNRISLRASGPWPATEFLGQHRREE